MWGLACQDTLPVRVMAGLKKESRAQPRYLGLVIGFNGISLARIARIL